MKILILALLLILDLLCHSQNVGINSTGSNPNSSAGLDIDFSDKGLLIPRVALSSKNMNSPIGLGITNSLIVYNTATVGISPNNVFPGFYYWSGSQWERILVSGNSSGGDWALAGNAGTTAGTNFLGTTDAQSLVIRTNNTERLWVDISGRVGIGGAPIGAQTFRVEANGTPEIHLWDGITNNFGAIFKYIPDNGSPSSNQIEFYNNTNTLNSKVMLYTGSGQQNNGMIINNLNNIGIGTLNPIQKLDINGRLNITGGVIQRGGGAISTTSDLGLYSGFAGNWIRLVTNNADINFFSDGGAGGTPNVSFKPNGDVGIGVFNPTYKLHVNGSVAGVGAYNNISDVTYKKDVVGIDNPLSKVLSLQGVYFNWRTVEFPDINFTDRRQLGFIAQEVEKVIPEVVNKDDNGKYTMAYTKIIPVLVEAIKEQQKLIENLQIKISELDLILGQNGLK